VAELDGTEGHSPVIIFGTNVDLGQKDKQEKRTSDSNNQERTDSLTD